MPNNRDAILLETVRTHRARLLAAFLFGEMSERRVANDNLKRLLGSIVLAAVVCAGCVGFSFVASLLAGQAAAQRAAANEGPATQPPFASDGFDRTVEGGWGQADLGGSWTMLGDDSGGYSVHDGAGRIKLTDSYRGGFLPAQQRDRTDVVLSFTAPSGPALIGVVGRRVGPTQDYRADVYVSEAGAVSIGLTTQQEGKGRVPISGRVIPSGVPQPGQPISVRLQVRGSNATSVRAKLWWGTAEPQSWTVAGSDGGQGLQRPGTVGVVAAGVGTVSVLDLVARPTNT